MILGRQAETDELADLIRQHRLVTVSGPGGVGKTTLARQILEQTDYVDRAEFVDLTSLSHHRLIHGIAGALGFATLEDLLGTCDESPWLIVVDNCEHMRDSAAAAIATLLQRCANIHVVATSREPLDLEPEFVLRLAPLSLVGTPSAAAALFLARTRSRGIDMAPHLVEVEAICSRLEGLPLAIELAAARSETMTPTELLSELDEPLGLLERRRARGPERHRSLAATIEASYRLLDESERTAFERLSVFEGRFTTDMAAAAIGDRGESRQLLESLTQRSLLMYEPVAGVSWFRMFEAIRAFAADQHTEHAATWGRVVDHVVSELTEAGASPIAVPDVLTEGFPTVRRVIETCLEDATPDRCHGLVASLWWLEDIGHQTEGADLVERIIAKWPDPTQSAATAYGVMALFHRLTERTEKTKQSALIAIGATDGLGAAFGHRALGQIARRQCLWDEALEHFALAVEAAETADERGWALEIQLHAAITQARAGEVDAAVTQLDDMLPETVAYPLCHHWTRLFLAWILLGSDRDRAVRLTRDVVRDSRQTPDRWITGVAEQHLGIAEAINGDHRAAARHLAASLEGFIAIRSLTDITLSHIAAAAVFQRLGDEQTAMAILAFTDRIGGRDGMGQFEQTMFNQISPVPEPTSVVDQVDNPWIVARLVELISAGEPTDAPQPSQTFRRSGDLWEVTFRDRSAYIPDSKGIGDIARLLASAGVELAALDLMGAGLIADGTIEASDVEARRKYEARIRLLQDDIDDAAAMNDPHRAETARVEMDLLLEHLTSSYGLSKRSRTSGDPAERARSAVTWRIRAAIKKIGSLHADLGDHLDASIRTGRFCVYEPSRVTDWQL